MTLVKDDERVKVFKNSENVGPVMNWLFGVQLSAGFYTKILFSDDILIPNSLENFYKEFHPDMGFVASSCLVGKCLKNSKKIYFYQKQNQDTDLNFCWCDMQLRDLL